MALPWLPCPVCIRSTDGELVLRALLAILNLTFCPLHVRELVERDVGVAAILMMGHLFQHDGNVLIVLCAIIINLSVDAGARAQLVANGLFRIMSRSIENDPGNASLQVIGSDRENFELY